MEERHSSSSSSSSSDSSDLPANASLEDIMPFESITCEFPHNESKGIENVSSAAQKWAELLKTEFKLDLRVDDLKRTFDRGFPLATEDLLLWPERSEDSNKLILCDSFGCYASSLCIYRCAPTNDNKTLSYQCHTSLAINQTELIPLPDATLFEQIDKATCNQMNNSDEAFNQNDLLERYPLLITKENATFVSQNFDRFKHDTEWTKRIKTLPSQNEYAIIMPFEGGTEGGVPPSGMPPSGMPPLGKDFDTDKSSRALSLPPMISFVELVDRTDCNMAKAENITMHDLKLSMHPSLSSYPVTVRNSSKKVDKVHHLASVQNYIRYDERKKKTQSIHMASFLQKQMPGTSPRGNIYESRRSECEIKILSLPDQCWVSRFQNPQEFNYYPITNYLNLQGFNCTQYRRGTFAPSNVFHSALKEQMHKHGFMEWYKRELDSCFASLQEAQKKEILSAWDASGMSQVKDSNYWNSFFAMYTKAKCPHPQALHDAPNVTPKQPVAVNTICKLPPENLQLLRSLFEKATGTKRSSLGELSQHNMYTPCTETCFSVEFSLLRRHVTQFSTNMLESIDALEARCNAQFMQIDQ